MEVGYIYKITSPTGGIYIGQTREIEKRKTDYKRRNCKRQKLIYKSIIRYGWDTHKLDIIYQTNCSDEELDNLEIFFIEFFHSYGVIYREYGLNLTKGGNVPRNWHHTPDAKEKIRLSGIGRIFSPESIEKRAKKLRGQKRTSEQIERITAANKKRIPVKIGGIKVIAYNEDMAIYKEYNSIGDALIENNFNSADTGKIKRAIKLNKLVFNKYWRYA